MKSKISIEVEIIGQTVSGTSTTLSSQFNIVGAGGVKKKDRKKELSLLIQS